jgi:hypothetical protein
LDFFSESNFFVVDCDASGKMVLLRSSAIAVGAGSVPGGAVGGARFVRAKNTGPEVNFTTLRWCIIYNKPQHPKSFSRRRLGP